MEAVEQPTWLGMQGRADLPFAESGEMPHADLPMDIEGHVDGHEGHWIRGWTWMPARPAQVAVVEAVRDGEVIAAGLASLYRADLELAGKRGGFCAFALYIDDPQEGEVEIRVCGAGGANLHGHRLAMHELSSLEEELPARMPLPFSPEAGVVGFIDHADGNLIKGWLYWRDGRPESVDFAVFEQGREIFRIDACSWRQDLAELRQGDGGCGFEAVLPAGVGEGRLRALDLCLIDAGHALLGAPLLLKSGGPPQASLEPVARAAWGKGPPPLAPSSRRGEVTLSIIVNFYNMQREAARTLTSLTRRYQRELDDLSYEVLCIDNGSDPPLDAAWVESFGPEFRLIRPEYPQPSPCSVINRVAGEARGDYLAIMIDGAHVLTPGVIHEAVAAFKEQRTDVVAVRHWFIGGDQRWLACSGYTREMEDRLFARIHWPKLGYEMFRIGAPIGESHDPWFGGLSESNCLFMKAPLFDRIGGMDEAFSMPGAGYANLDVLRRAAAASDNDIVCLLGEATFHQYHDGTTTNVSDDEKDARVRAYVHEYRKLRGEEFQVVEAERLRLRGSIRSEHATSVHHRPLLPMTLGVTDRVRPGNLHQHLASGARQHLQSVYAECGLFQHTQWMGLNMDLAPADLVEIQDIIRCIQPSRIVTTCGKAGLVAFLASMLDIYGLAQSRIVVVGAPPALAASHPRVIAVEGHPSAPQTLGLVEEAVGLEESTLVLFEPAADDAVPSQMLAAYASLVSYRSYLIFLGTVLGQPWLGYSSRWYLAAIRRFLAEHPSFAVDHSRERQLVSFCAHGYLRKVGSATTAADYDPSLDRLDEYEGERR